MKDSGGTKEVIIFEFKDLPAIVDADDQENVISFAVLEDEAEDPLGDYKKNNDETIH